MIALLALLHLAHADPQATFDAAVAEAQAHPQDYATLVHAAYAASAAGQHEASLTFWSQAEALSGPTYEVLQGTVQPLLALGRTGDAVRRARQALPLAPELSWAKLQFAHLQRQRGPSVWWAEERFAANVRHARRLDPDVPAFACWLAESRFVRGDRWGARALAKDQPCNTAFADLLAPTWTLGAGTWVLGSGWSGHTHLNGGVGAIARAWASFDDHVELSLTGRTNHLHATYDDLTTWVRQHDVWASAKLYGRGHGLQLLGGSAFPDIDPTYNTPDWRVGGRAWGTWFVTLTGEALFGRTTWGTNLQLAGSLSANVYDRLTAWGTLRFTQAAVGRDTDSTYGPDTAEQLTGLAADLGLTYRAPTWSAHATARLGTEAHPFRMSTFTLWNTGTRLGPSLSAGASYRPMPKLTLTLDYDLATQADDLTGSFHGVTAGFTVQLAKEARP